MTSTGVLRSPTEAMSPTEAILRGFIGASMRLSTEAIKEAFL